MPRVFQDVVAIVLDLGETQVERRAILLLGLTLGLEVRVGQNACDRQVLLVELFFVAHFELFVRHHVFVARKLPECVLV